MQKQRIEKRLQPPKQQNIDKVKSFVKAIMNGVPVSWSGTASELINMIFTPSYEKRLHEWRGIIADFVLEVYNRKQFTIADLQSNEETISLLQQACIAGIRTHQEEKRKLLRNALFNSVDSKVLYDTKSIFFRVIDELTLSHIEVLKTLHQYQKYLHFSNNIRSLHETMTKGEPLTMSKKNSQMFVPAIHPVEETQLGYILNDLKSKNLLYLSDAFTDDSGGEIYKPSVRLMEDDSKTGIPFLKVTDLGIQFLEFIRKDEPATIYA